MASVNNVVWRIIAEDPSIQKDLSRGLINTRALSRYIIDNYQLKASMDAVISAIRRFETETVFKDDRKNIQEVIKNAIISTKNYVTCITIKDGSFDTICRDYLNEKILRKNIRVIKGKERVKLFINQKDLDEKLKLFKKSDVIKVQKDLGEIRIQLNVEKAEETRGILASMSHQIALHGVNIEETVIALPDFLFYVKQEDLLRAHKGILSINE